eukprot:2501267-Pyramimonas_sp.AAC.1
MDDLIFELVAHKNRFWHRGGFSPLQLVFGENPRLPHDLLSDGHKALPGWQDVTSPSSEQDEAGAEFARAHAIRAAARRMAMEATARDNISRASRARTPGNRRFTPGQWVFVWRHFTRMSSRADALGRRRAGWTGPGVV